MERKTLLCWMFESRNVCTLSIIQWIWMSKTSSSSLLRSSINKYHLNINVKFRSNSWTSQYYWTAWKLFGLYARKMDCMYGGKCSNETHTIIIRQTNYVRCKHPNTTASALCEKIRREIYKRRGSSNTHLLWLMHDTKPLIIILIGFSFSNA